MKKNKILVTGSSGLVGGEVVNYFCDKDFLVYGIDNNMRGIFFGANGSTEGNLIKLRNKFSNFSNYNIDIRDRNAIDNLICDIRPDVIVHTAAQPSHDKAAEIPFLDFEVNALGTLNLLEAARNYCKESPFIHLSTNKVYGESPNQLDLIELESRWDYSGHLYKKGIGENFNIDQSTHSLYGVSKLSSDLIVQEYGRYFNMPTCCLRACCITGPSQSGVELHGFLNYLIRCNIFENKYFIYGYKGKQVRDNIHSFDVANFIYSFIRKPKVAAVYNIGGGFQNSVSVLEAIEKIENISEKKMKSSYLDKARVGDHICYYSDLSKIKLDYPDWEITKSIDDIFVDIHNGLINKKID